MIFFSLLSAVIAIVVSFYSFIFFSEILEAILIGVFLEQSSSMLKGIFVVGWKLKNPRGQPSQYII
jgi:hypothetical protein